ncbi:MAG: 2-succinyl-5-enolpyruvyl-6-hydroxy-3-cyclohexene-1-carboxylic-acid synthase [Ilumatobacteraceae bacterium]
MTPSPDLSPAFDVSPAFADDQATFCATLADELVARGVRHAVVAPGSRSTPMALALAGRRELAVHIVHDERAAAFVALGLGLDGVPAVVLCTSGTAAANLHPAVVEAGLSAVPMIVLTADRPPELRDVGAPQTIDQTHLFGRSVRWFHDPGVPDVAASASWRSLAGRAVTESRAGPVHLNLPFREPLVGTSGPLPPRRPVAGAAPATIEDPPEALVALVRAGRGLILAGGGCGAGREVIARFADATGWPVLADPTSGLRDLDGAVGAFDAILRHPAADVRLRPDVIVRLGRPAASRVLSEWVAASGAVLVQVGGPGTIDPDHGVVASLAPAALDHLAARLGRVGDPTYRAAWIDAGTVADAAIGELLGPEVPLTEPGVARTIAAHLPPGAALVVASSMPVRDLEWYGGPTARAHANRGANGIDGVVSTALGVALGGTTTVALVGDIAFVHDAGALTALAARLDADLRVVVVDNDGGGIFSFLPQATTLGGERFEQLFGTPHGTDVAALGRAHGIDSATVTTAAELVARLAAPGPSVTRVATDRAENVRVHGALNAAVVAALDAAGV